jgi:hypothetical protein
MAVYVDDALIAAMVGRITSRWSHLNPPTPRSAPAISNPVIVLDAEPHDV